MIATSPPYVAISAGAGGLNTRPARDGQQGGRDPDSPSQQADQHYGETSGQLSVMLAGSAESLVTSSPYEGSLAEDAGGSHKELYVNKYGGGNIHPRCYGENTENIGNETGETFWSAARMIVEQCYAILSPGAHAAWVLKAFVRNKKIVDFPKQWQQLCESVGFETVVIARAWQVKDDGTQLAIDGKHKHLHKEHKGFFRRNHEKKFPATRIDFEIVLFQVRP